jgi:hypothetical protein
MWHKRWHDLDGLGGEVPVDGGEDAEAPLLPVERRAFAHCQDHAHGLRGKVK